MSPRKPGISGVGSSAVLVVVVGWGKVSPATDLAVKISRRHRCFPVEQVLREAERETGEKVAENICLLQSWVRRTRTKKFGFSMEASEEGWLCECWSGRRLAAFRAGLLAKRGGRASGAWLTCSERWR